MEINFAVWNIEWMNDLFDSEGAFKSDDATVRGPKKGSTVALRRRDLSSFLNDLNLDVVVIVEGPNRAIELQRFFDADVDGDWKCDVQPSKGSQIIGVAVRVDTGKFQAGEAFARIHIGEGQGGEAQVLSEAVADFALDTDGDGILELHKFERMPLFVELNAADGKKFRILGLHLKSKGVFGAYEWSKWWSMANANRMKIIAQCSQLRDKFLDRYLSEEETKNIPLIVCGDINDGPGFDTSEGKLNTSGVERLMGSVWKPKNCLGNALFDSLSPSDRAEVDLSSIYTTSFEDPLLKTYRKSWIDHILYTRNGEGQWVHSATSRHTALDGERTYKKYPYASDHFPVTAIVETDGI